MYKHYYQLLYKQTFLEGDWNRGHSGYDNRRQDWNLLTTIINSYYFSKTAMAAVLYHDAAAIAPGSELMKEYLETRKLNAQPA